MSYKDIWFANMERELAEELDRNGEDFDAAYEKATEKAFTQTAEGLLDAADAERTRRKGG